MMKNVFIGASALVLAFATNLSIAANGHKSGNPAKKAKRFDCASCTGESMKCINNVCVLGARIYTASDPLGDRYKCTYYYRWPDGSVSQEYTEISYFPCPL
ncbi:hypothetical protein [Chitinophaga sp. HK235]|uniref:hypothetical protein n=1 Tax=Chitinophaga sp. HK235 TaxID=2952571 RepID=UPI001BA98E56|nr:hypothetical protein [Chitinophaga sp. HK235]